MITEEDVRKLDVRAQRFAEESGVMLDEEMGLALRAAYIGLYGIRIYVRESAHFADEVRRVIMEERDMDILDYLLEED